MGLRSILICGNGASAAILLCALARKTRKFGISVRVIGNGGWIGEGVAYATINPNHLLNVPAYRMSAEPLQPDHFVRWLKSRGVTMDGWSGQFVPRSLYADYLDRQVRQIFLNHTDLFVKIQAGKVRNLIRNGMGWIVSHSTGDPFFADSVVLATGNDMPTPIAGCYGSDIAHCIIDNPWAGFHIPNEENVLILGTGLTAIDAVISLLDKGHAGAIHLLSRHGLLPECHIEPATVRPLETPYPTTTLGLMRALRGAVGRTPGPEQWQGLMDAMRPHWSEIWQKLSVIEKRRFLRHGATQWSVMRHRIAPQIHARIKSALSRNVAVLRGQLRSVARIGKKSIIATISRGDNSWILPVNRIINCTGPNTNPDKTHDMLIENIIASRFAHTSPAGIGLDVDERNRVRDAEGKVQTSLFAMGALTRGRWWEITAIPEIARQATNMADDVMEQLGVQETDYARIGRQRGDQIAIQARSAPKNADQK